MQDQTEIKETKISHPWKIFLWEAFLFLIVFGLGIVSAFRVKELSKIEKIEISPVSFWQFLLYFSLATLFILFISLLGKRFKKGKQVIFKAIFIFAIIGGGIIFFSIWLPDFFALILVVILIFGWLIKPKILFHNLVMIFGVVGIGGVLGLSFSPLVMVVILIIFSIYDYIAVYKTKHMVRIAKEMVEAGAILGFILPQKTSDFLADLKEVAPGGKFLILGGGDMVFPLIFSISLIPSGILNCLIVAFFAFLGLLVSFLLFISQKTRKPIPALPPIALFSIIGFLITKIL